MKKSILLSVIVVFGILCPLSAASEKSGKPSSVAAPSSRPSMQQAKIPDTLHKPPVPPAAAAFQPSQSAQSAAVFDQAGFVKPGEAIRIYAFPDTGSFVNGFYPVDGEGRIYLPIIGKMSVMGMSEKAFLDTLKAQYISYLRYPNLQVRHSIRISLLGGFQRPGLYYVDPDYSLWDAVYLAGGTTREDGLKRMQWERDRLPVAKDVIPYYQSGQSLRSIGFKSGDQLWTPVESKRKLWEVILKDVVMSYIFPIVTTSASVYVTYLMYQSYNKPSANSQ